MVAVLGVVSAVLFGASDFFGGLAAKLLPSIVVAAIGNLVAAILVGLVVLLSHPVWSAPAVLWGVAAGIGGAVGTAGLYAVLAVGPMSILSPTVAALYAIIPAGVGIALGERLPVIGYVALGVVFVAGMLLAVTREPGGRRIRPGILALAVLSGVGFAAYIIAIDQAPHASGMIPLLTELIVGALCFAPVIAVRAARSRTATLGGLRDRGTLVQTLVCGGFMAVGTMLLVLGLQLGDLAVMSVLNSIYPLGTVLLAILVLKERLSAVQGVGIALALAGSVVLGLTA